MHLGKQLLILIVGIAAVREVRSADCSNMPKIPPQKCCKQPPFKDLETVSKIVTDVKAKNLDPYMTECKVDEEIMKGLKLAANDDLDLEAHDKYFETIFESERMKQTYIVAAKKCHQEVTAKLPAIISKYEAEPFNIKKEMCNIKFMAVTTCVQVQAHLTCPKEFVVDRPECSESRAWMEQCSPNVYSFTEMAMNLKAA